MPDSAHDAVFARFGAADAGDAGRLIVVSNRLPIRLEATEAGLQTRRSSGGLAAALAGLDRDRMVWVGWPGCVVDEAHRRTVRERLGRDHLVPVFLSAAQEQDYYRGLCNEALWPLFHYFTDRVAFSPAAWDQYVTVNRMFAEQVLEVVGDEPATVWVHDFHLMLVPSMLRHARPDLAIGFFLHIPFPSSEIYRLLPRREAILEGVLGADYVSFHTSDYALHFRRACLRALGVPSERDAIEYQGRHIGLGVDPIGIDVESFARVVNSPEAAAELAELERRYRSTRLLLGVERLDYSKGISLKLDAYEKFLERDPRRAREVTLLQVLVPSRLSHPDYRDLKGEIEQQVGRINGRFGGPGVVPVQYMHRSVTPAELVALYRFADVGLITPIRDGMNLVAQEFVACQLDHKGVIVLSEFAGAAHYLTGAELVNPWDVDHVTDAIEAALAMPADERRRRLEPMQQRVERMDCRRWAARYLERLRHFAGLARRRRSTPVLTPVDELRLVERFVEAPRCYLLLDYDGTLRELARSPDEARPSADLRQILAEVAATPGVEVHVISGRDRATLDAWLGDLPVFLSAEHGFVARGPEDGWRECLQVDTSWLPRIRDLLQQVVDDVPGTMLETKAAALAWHYRMADLDYGLWRARELQNTLEEVLAHDAAEVLHGSRVIEVRASGVNKGNYVRVALRDACPGDFVLCAGDDRTDLDMFRALPDYAIAVEVGGHLDAGALVHYAVSDAGAIRNLLRRLAEAGRTARRET